MRTIIQNGTIVSDTAAFRADLLLEDGVVKAVAEYCLECVCSRTKMCDRS